MFNTIVSFACICYVSVCIRRIKYCYYYYYYCFQQFNYNILMCYFAGALCCGTAAGGSEASLGSIYPGGPGPSGIDESYSTTGAGDDLRDLFLLCPKCVLLRHAHPGCSYSQ